MGSGLVIVPPIMMSDSDNAAPDGAEETAEAAKPAEPSKPDEQAASAAEPAGETVGVKRPSKPPEAPEKTADAKLADAQAEAARMREQFLRTAADFDNYRKRSRRDQDDAQRRGREQMLKDLLPVFDNLERAVQHAEGAPDAKAVADGVRMVLKQFLDTLGKIGVKRIVTVGKAFDPTQHEAIQHLESAEHPAGTILAEVQAGYMIGDYLIRPALVVVSKGAPEGAAPAPN
jgi:molecular chaperone GrpE